HVTGVGCASAVPLFKLATQTLAGHSERHTLVVAAESMSGILMPAQEDDPRAKTVGSALFGDGCAAALLSADPRAEGPLVLDSQVHQIPGTLDAVQLECDADDSHLHLARELPYLAGAELEQIVAGFLRRNRVGREQIDHWIVHPGGRRIVENVQTALSLSDAEIALSWQALADHGNVGTPSIFYVLSETIEQREPEPGERGLIVTIGPGVTVGLMLLGW
ncbi:MAG TPA: 3-oxoacyl-[acyl-carrier-protein] synthase III C-terminal domain-containing protein, partial [Solirubrobacteraceae bacterium]|nr:3-oxoacyl-[acyl-carrier-protein] synthase III C-terminal domain-containing protein [Solirubrobacteraceae bacterium]